MSNKELYCRVIRKFGIEYQMGLLQEECAELIQAVSKYRRNNGSIDTIVKLLEEMADVEIMIEQMKVYFNASVISFNLSKNEKLQRLEKMLEE